MWPKACKLPRYGRLIIHKHCTESSEIILCWSQQYYNYAATIHRKQHPCIAFAYRWGTKISNPITPNRGNTGVCKKNAPFPYWPTISIFDFLSEGAFFLQPISIHLGPLLGLDWAPYYFWQTCRSRNFLPGAVDEIFWTLICVKLGSGTISCFC